MNDIFGNEMEQGKEEKRKRKPKDNKKVVKGEVVRERKGKERTNLPVKLPDHTTWLKQPNIITLLSYDFKTLQIRILISIIEKLQSSIEQSINKVAFEQLSLFKEFNDKNKLLLSIPTKDFGIGPESYPELRAALREMASIPVEFDAEDPVTGADSFAISGLFKAYIPKESHSRSITIEIEKQVAKNLVNVDRGYTKFIKEVAFKTQSKYTVRFYMLISSWVDKGGFSITIAKFRKWLKLENKYKDYKDLYKRVIRPVYEELFENANCWFEVAEVYKGETDTEPHKLRFKVIRAAYTYKEKEYMKSHTNQLKEMLRTHFKMEDKHLNKIIPLLNLSNINVVINKVIFLREHLMKHAKDITSIPDYCTGAILNTINEPFDTIGIVGDSLEEEVETDAEVVDDEDVDIK